MTRRLQILLVMLIVSISLGGCAAVVPGPSPTATPAAVLVPPSTSTPRVLSPGEADLARLVAAAQKEGTVTVYAGTWIGDIGTAVSSAFQQKYGIRMEILIGKGTDFIERVKTEQRVGQFVADLQEVSSASATMLEQAGLSMPLVDLPVFQEQGVWISNPLGATGKGPSAGYTFLATNIWINTKLVPPASEPHSLKDLLDPKWKGKIAMPEPTINSSPTMMFVPLVSNKTLDWETVKGFARQDMKYARSTTELFRQMLARGEAYVTPVGADTIGASAAAEGAPLKAVPFDEGTVVSLLGVALVKNSPHPNSARLLANWLLSVDGQTVILRASGNPTIRKDGPDFRPAAVRYQMKRVIAESPSDSEEIAAKMRERFLANLWKQ